jgi:hypothetical protein
MRKKPPEGSQSISVIFTPEEVKAIDAGPLEVSGGRGKASYIRFLVQEDLKRYRKPT